MQPDLQSADNDMKLHRRWEFENTQGRVFFWNDDRGGFDYVDSEYIGDEALSGLIEEAYKGIREGLAKNHIRSFEIRPVSALRR